MLSDYLKVLLTKLIMLRVVSRGAILMQGKEYGAFLVEVTFASLLNGEVWAFDLSI